MANPITPSQLKALKALADGVEVLAGCNAPRGLNLLSFESLERRGLVQCEDRAYQLTERGCAALEARKENDMPTIEKITTSKIEHHIRKAATCSDSTFASVLRNAADDLRDSATDAFRRSERAFDRGDEDMERRAFEAAEKLDKVAKAFRDAANLLRYGHTPFGRDNFHHLSDDEQDELDDYRGGVIESLIAAS